MRFALRSPVVALVALAAAGEAAALGFGRFEPSVALGRSLDVTVPVRLREGEVLEADCVNAEVLLGDSRVPREQLVITLEGRGNDRLLRVRSRVAVDEPVLQMNLALGCPPTLSGRFTAFADPPTIAPPVAEAAPAAAGSPAAPSAAAGGSGDGAPASATPRRFEPRLGRAPAVRGTDASAASSTRRARPATEQAAAPTRAPRERQAAARPRTESGARLRLEATEPVLARGPAAAASAAAVAASAAAAAQAELAAAQAELASRQAQVSAAQERAKALQDQLARVQAESRAQQDQLAQLKTRLAQRQGSVDWMAWAPWLVAMVALLAALAAALAWRVRRLQREKLWWQASHESSEFLGDTRALVRGAASAVPDEAHALPEPEEAQPPATVMPVAEPTLPPPQAAPAAVAAVAVPRARPSLEEQIDLEQQAEFFLVLGQDEAAVDLLLTHLRETGGTTPMPYLKLMQIYRARGDREAYDRMRDRFERRFNGRAPAWDDEGWGARSLEDYAPALEQVQHAWLHPLDALAVIEALLFRRGEASERFDLPAYEDLLFLYNIAREAQQRLEGHSDTGVDLLLPIEDSAPAGMSVRHLDLPVLGEAEFDPEATRAWGGPSSFRPLGGTAAAKPNAVDLDLDLGATPPAPGRG